MEQDPKKLKPAPKFRLGNLPGPVRQARDVWSRFRFVIAAIVTLLILVLYVQLLNGINTLLEGKHLGIQYFTWTVLSLATLSVAGLVIYLKGQKDGGRDLRELARELKLHLSEYEAQNKKMQQAMDHYEQELQRKEEKIASLEKKIHQKDEAFHDLREEIKKVKAEDVKNALLKKWNDARGAAERTLEAPVKVIGAVREVPGEFAERSRWLYEKTQQLVKKTEDESRKGMSFLKQIFRGKKPGSGKSEEVRDAL